MVYWGESGDVSEVDSYDGDISFQWSIPDFISYPSEGGNSCTSPTFEACGGEWSLEIYPNGFREYTAADWASLFFYRTDEGPPLTIDVTIGIMGPYGVENKRRRRKEFSGDDDVSYWKRFCSKELCDDICSQMPSDELIITIDIKNAEPSYPRDPSTQTAEETEQEKQGMEELTESLQRLFTSGEDSDVLIKVRGKEFPAHRAILRARSPVFHAMFAHDMVERQGGAVTMDDCDPESFSAFLDHIYTGSTAIISMEKVFSLYIASDKYDMGTLKKACAEFVKSNLNVSCFCDAITLAVRHDEKELVELATEFFCSNSLDICKTVEWRIFLQENTTIGNELLIKAFSKYFYRQF